MKKTKHYGTIIESPSGYQSRVVVGVPITGLIRAEWAIARWGQVTPTNWSQTDVVSWMDQYSPLRYSVADARNLVVQRAIDGGFEWIFFIDHDVVLPPGTLIRMNKYMIDCDYPIVNGLYFTRSVPSEPLMYRGLGTGYFSKWKMGDKVWVDGCGLGCTLIHRSIFETMYKESEPYVVRGSYPVRRVFITPAGMAWDETTKDIGIMSGTEDLNFYHRIKDGGVYQKAGWSKFQKKKYPLMVDTDIFCRHIDHGGTQYPACGEEREYMKEQ